MKKISQRFSWKLEEKLTYCVQWSLNKLQMEVNGHSVCKNTHVARKNCTLAEFGWFISCMQ